MEAHFGEELVEERLHKLGVLGGHLIAIDETCRRIQEGRLVLGARESVCHRLGCVVDPVQICELGEVLVGTAGSGDIYVTAGDVWNSISIAVLQRDGVEQSLDTSDLIRLACSDDRHAGLRENVRFWLDLRNAVAHRYLLALDVSVIPHAQAGLLNFERTIVDGVRRDLVLAVVEPPWGPPENGFARQPSSVEVLDWKNGCRVRHVEVSYPAAAFASNGGRFILRNVNWNTKDESESLFFADVAGEAEPVVVGGYDLFNHPFRIRRASDLLRLVGDSAEPSRNKWVARVVREERRSTTAIERLFPLEWVASRGAHIMGGPGCWVADGQEASLVHSGWLHDGRGLLGGNSFLVCRSGRSGEPQWEYRASAQFSGVDGHRVVPLSMCGADGWLAIGLLDGRVLRFRL